MTRTPKHRRDSDDTDLRFNLHRLIMADDALSPLGKNCASTLLFGFMNGKTGRCDPSYDDTAKALGTSRRNAIRGVEALRSAGWVTVRHTFREVGGAQVHGNNVFEFAFDRLDRPALKRGPVPEFGGDRIDTTPGDEIDTKVVTASSPRGVTGLSPKQREENKEVEQQESLFGEGGLPQAPPYDFEPWFEQQWWPQYLAARRVEKAAAKKLAKAIIEGRRSDGLKATPDELLAGVMRYAAVMTGKDPQYIKHPPTWLNKGCWADEHGERAGAGGRTTSTDAVWGAIDEMAARSRRAAG